MARQLLIVCFGAGLALMQLDPEAPPGLIATVASERGLPLTIVQPGIDLPADIRSAAAGLIVLGAGVAGLQAIATANHTIRVVRRAMMSPP